MHEEWRKKSSSDEKIKTTAHTAGYQALFQWRLVRTWRLPDAEPRTGTGLAHREAAAESQESNSPESCGGREPSTC